MEDLVIRLLLETWSHAKHNTSDVVQRLIAMVKLFTFLMVSVVMLQTSQNPTRVETVTTFKYAVGSALL